MDYKQEFTRNTFIEAVASIVFEQTKGERIETIDKAIRLSAATAYDTVRLISEFGVKPVAGKEQYLASLESAVYVALHGSPVDEFGNRDDDGLIFQLGSNHPMVRILSDTLSKGASL